MRLDDCRAVFFWVLPIENFENIVGGGLNKVVGKKSDPKEAQEI